MPVKDISPLKASTLFILATAYFFALLYTLLPFLKENFTLNPAVYWFITGYFLFIPLFLYAVAAARQEGNRDLKSVLQALNVRRLSRSDMLYSVSGLIIVFLLTGVIFALSELMHRFFGTETLSTTPWFMEIHPFRGGEILLLFVWLPMFFFNIVGEELLWRGYIQTRLPGRYAWLLCSLLWLFFHLPFGLDLMIMLLPVTLIIPYVFAKTRNATTGIFIHGIYNGPLFILVALGLI